MVQRIGSALNLNLHFHLLIPDGAWVPGPSGGPPLAPVFRSVQEPTTQDVENLVVRLADACERFLARRGFGEGDLADDDADPDDAQVLLQQASLAGVAALGGRAGRQAPARGPVGSRSTAAARTRSPPTAPDATATTCMPESASEPSTVRASSACAATSPDPPWVARASRSRTTAPSSST